MIAIAHTLADRGDDVYDTPDVAVEALLRAEKYPEMAVGGPVAALKGTGP